MYSGTFEPNRLDNLLQSNRKAKEYFMALGEAEQGMLRQRSNEVHSLADMEEMAQRLTF